MLTHKEVHIHTQKEKKTAYVTLQFGQTENTTDLRSWKFLKLPRLFFLSFY